MVIREVGWAATQRERLPGEGVSVSPAAMQQEKCPLCAQKVQLVEEVVGDKKTGYLAFISHPIMPSNKAAATTQTLPPCDGSKKRFMR